MKPAAAAVLVAALSLAVALFLTPAVRALARSLGLIARPTADRWHTRPTALMGGIAIAAGTLVGVVAWFALSAFGWSTGFAAAQPWPRAVAASATFMFGAGAALGFLRYNFHPASIFMGDAGSLFIGSLLAGLVVTSPASVSGSLVAVLFVPLAIVAVPVVDTALVAVTRALASRAISQGGKDHSTHRLVALGLGERQVALLLYLFAAFGGGVGLVLMRLDLALGLVLGTVFLAGMSVMAAYLGRLQVGYSDRAAGWKPVTMLVTELMYKRRLAELLLDVSLVAVAYYGAYRLRFEGGAPPVYMQGFQSTLGLVIAVKVAAFGLLGVYRGAWRYTGIVDLYRILGAII